MTFTGLKSRYVMVRLVLFSVGRRRKTGEDIPGVVEGEEREREWGICALLKSVAYIIRHTSGNALNAQLTEFSDFIFPPPPRVNTAEKKLQARD